VRVAKRGFEVNLKLEKKNSYSVTGSAASAAVQELNKYLCFLQGQSTDTSAHCELEAIKGFVCNTKQNRAWSEPNETHALQNHMGMTQKLFMAL
jgi:hypothetical protein